MKQDKKIEKIKKKIALIDSKLKDSRGKEKASTILKDDKGKEKASTILKDDKGKEKASTIFKITQKQTDIKDSKLKDSRDKEKVPTILKSYNPVKADKITTIKGLKTRFKDKFFPDKTLLVNMELLNGFHKLFLVVEKDNGFRYRNKQYIFDNESKYYIIDAKLWCYDFHEDFTIPIKRKIPVSAIKKAVELSELTEVENSVNPATIERFLKAKIAEGIMKGQQLDIVFKQLKLIGIVTMLSSVIMLILFLFKTGMLQSIKIPGIS